VVVDTKSWRDYRTLSGKQRAALDFITRKGRAASIGGRRRYCLYGGAGWGGKSYLLRSAAFEIVMDLRDRGFPNQWVTIYTLDYPSLEDRHIRKLDTEFAGIGKFSDSNRYGLHMKFFGEGLGGVFFRNIDSGSNTGRGGGKRPGAESVGALIDEPTEMGYDDFVGINYVTRPGSLNLPYIPILMGANPDGIGHKWVKEIFHPKYRRLTWPIFNGKGAATAEDFLFIQAKKEDNPAYEELKDQIDQIMSMIGDPDIRRAREDGSWDLYVSGRFSMWRDEVHKFRWEDLYEEHGIPHGMPPEEFIRECHFFGFKVYASFDYGTSDSSVSAYYLHLVGPDNHVWTFARLRMSGIELEDQADKIIEFEAKMGCHVTLRYADPALWGKDKKKDALNRAERFRKLGLTFHAGDNSRVEGASTVAFMLSWTKTPDGRMARSPRWRIHSGEAFWPGCPELCDQIPDLPRDPSEPEDVDPNDGKNHDYDSVRYFLHTRFKGGRATEKTLLTPGSPEWFREVAKLQKRGKTTGDWL